LEPLAKANANYFVRNAPLCAATATLLVYRSASFARDLAELETVVAKFFCEWFVELAFLTLSLSRSARFLERSGDRDRLKSTGARLLMRLALHLDLPAAS